MKAEPAAQAWQDIRPDVLHREVGVFTLERRVELRQLVQPEWPAAMLMSCAIRAASAAKP
jgi:hypothetical protein